MTNRASRTPLLCLALSVLSAACGAQPTPTAAPSRPFVIVANQRSGVATLVEVSTGRISHVDLGGRPHEVAVSPDGRLAILTIPMEALQRSSRRALVMDLATTRVVRTIDLGEYREPHGVAFISDSVALVGTLGGTSVVYVNARTGRVLRAVEGLAENPYVIKTTPTGRALVSSPHSSVVSEIDVASSRLLRRISNISDDPAGIAVSADGKELYAAVWRDKVGGGIAIYDLDRGSVSVKLPATQPRRMTVTEDQKYLVVSDRDHLRIVDRATRQVRSVETGRNGGGSGVACSPDSTRCYTALSQAGEIIEVDVVAARVIRRFAAERGVDGVAYVR